MLQAPRFAAHGVATAAVGPDRTEARDDRAQRDAGDEPNVWHVVEGSAGSPAFHDASVMVCARDTSTLRGYGTHHLARHRSHRRGARGGGGGGGGRRGGAGAAPPGAWAAWGSSSSWPA